MTDDFHVLITGSRTWDCPEKVEACLDYLHLRHGSALVVVHGACPAGGDLHADLWCRLHDVRQRRYPADWSQGPAAGPRRNAAMVATGPDICLAFIRDNSRGATGCADLAEKAGIPTVRYRR